jgi:DNA-binding protein WhiA
MVRVHGEIVPLVLQELSLFGDPDDQAFASKRFKKCCARSFMRGFFLGAGFVGSPGKGHHLELAVKDQFTAQMIVRLLEKHEILAKVGRRKTGPLIYIKHGTDIADFLSMIGANAALMAYENVRAYKTVRSRVNRLVNMETANLTKTAAAAYRQVEDIKYIEQRVGFGSLPDALVEMATLRLDHPEATLEELGRLATSPVGKSGVNHRLRRLTAIAAELRESSS